MKQTILKSFIYILKVLCSRFPVATVKIRYWLRFRHFPNLEAPNDLNEKILYLKLYSDTTLWTHLADKYSVRQYVESCGLSSILIPIYGAWDNEEDIPFDKLPQTFILKANNGDGKGTNLKVDKAAMSDDDWLALKRKLRCWLNDKYIGALSAEPQYRAIKPMIIAEQLLPNAEGDISLVDYKLWCFNGEPFSFLVCSGRHSNGYEVELSCYDLEWNYLPGKIIATKHVSVAQHQIRRPQCLHEMVEVARRLSKPFPQVRVDMYEVDGKVYFGELTFTSLGGMMNYYNPEYLQEMGSKIKLSS